MNSSTPRSHLRAAALPGFAGRRTVLAAVALAFAVAASVLRAGAQAEYVSLRADPTPPTEAQPSGGWRAARVDREAVAEGTAGTINSGALKVLPGDGPDFLNNGLKLRHGGNTPSPDGADQPAVFGAVWDYHHPVQAALKLLGPVIPANGRRVNNWRPEDQGMVDLGRPAMPYLRARIAFEAALNETLGRVLCTHMLLRVLDGAPEKLPEVKDGDDVKRTVPYDGDAMTRAALRLGSRGHETLTRMAAMLPADSTDQKLKDWIKFLDREYTVLDRGLGAAVKDLTPNFPLSGDDRQRWPDADRLIVEQWGLAAVPFLESLRASDSTYAPKVDWMLGWVRAKSAADVVNRLEELSRQGLLKPDYFDQRVAKAEKAAGTEKPAAPAVPAGGEKAEDRPADGKAEDKPAEPKPVEPKPSVPASPFGPVGSAFAGLVNADDFYVMLVAPDQLGAELKRRHDIAASYLVSTDDKIKEKGGWMMAAIDATQNAMRMFLDPANNRRTGDIIARLRENPADPLGSYAVLLDVDAKQIGETERLRQFASAMHAKCNLIWEAIRDRDQEPASDMFIEAAKARAEASEPKLMFTAEEYAAMRASGEIEVTAATLARSKITAENAAATLDKLNGAGMLTVEVPLQGPNRYFFRGDPAYRRLARLSPADFDTLASGQPVMVSPGVMFRGNENNNGANYDYQADIDKRGLSIEMVPAAGATNRIPFALEPGRSYTLSFEYRTRGMRGASTWVSFIPLDENGRDAVELMSPDEDESVVEGLYVSYRFSRHSSEGGLDSPRYGGTSDGWQTVRFLINRVPDGIHGFRLAFRIDRLTGAGAAWYRNIKLDLKTDFFREDFEFSPYRSEFAADGTPKPALADAWTPYLDPARHYMPSYSRVSYTSVNLPAGSKRALMIEPNGFNARYETNAYFEFRPDRSYLVSAMTQTENMGSMRAYYEVMLYGIKNGQRVPVTVDGVATTEGMNVMRSPKRGDNNRSIGLGGVAVGGGWTKDELYFDELRRIELEDLRGGGDWAQIDGRERLGIRLARLAIVCEGPNPEHAARIAVDNIEIREFPRVALTLGQQKLDPSSGLTPAERRWNAPEKIGSVFAKPNPPQSPDRFRLFIEVSVEGLAPQRAGYHYTLTLKDYLGNPVKALDILGAQRLDRVVYSSSQGSIGSEEFNRIYLDDLDLRNTFGYFAADFELRYADGEQPLFHREFLIGFVPPSLMGDANGIVGDFGVVLDSNSEKQGRLATALNLLGVGRLMVPLLAQDMSLEPGAYAGSALVRDARYLMAMLPRAKMSGIIGPMPDALQGLTLAAGAEPVFTDSTRSEWKKVFAEMSAEWRARFDDFVAGDPADGSYTAYSADAAKALDNLSAEFAAAGQAWAPRAIPVTLDATGGTAALEALQRSFNSRWASSVDSMDAAMLTAVTAGLSAADMQKLREAKPNLLLLRDKEELCFSVPANVSGAAMETMLRAWLMRIARAKNPLGDNATDAHAAAKLVAGGGTLAHGPLAGALASPMSHSLIVDLPAVDPSRDMTYAMQLRDLTEKLVRARQMGFNRVYLSRVRDSGVLPDGLLTRDNRAHPAFYAFRTLNAVLSGKEVTPLQLDLASGARHTFFRDTKTGELTFFIFPGDKSVTENLPFGHNVSRIDLMGNPVPLPSGTGKGDLGTVRVVLEPNGLPVILTGIDTQLMDAMQAVKLDDATIQGYEGDQRKKLSVTNTFSTAITLTVRIPLAADENDLDNIARDARFKTSQGNEVAESMSEYRFESVELAPGATRDFEFMLRPRQSMKTGSRVLPITLQIRGQREYAVTRRLPVTVNPLVSVAKIDLVDPGDGRGYDVVMRVADTSGRNGAYVATVSLPGMEGTRPLTRDFSIAGNGFADVTRRMQAATAAQLEGQVLRLSLRQNPGAMFFNEDYVVRKNYSTGGLMLVRERDERSAMK